MPGAEEQAIAALLDQFTDAWNRHDGQAIAGLFAEDGDFVNVIGRWAQGRPAIEVVMVRNHQTIFRESRLAQTDLVVRFPRPEVAVVHATWELTGERNQADVLLPPRRGIITLLLTQATRGWEITAFQNTDIRAPATPTSS